MPIQTTAGFSQYYELHGDPGFPPMLLVSGLGGVGASWGPQPGLLSGDFHLIVPDQRGTGRTDRAVDGYTTHQLADDMAALVGDLGVGPVHVVGSSTGGAIAQQMALHHPDLVQSLTIASSFARFDAYMRRQFEVRRTMAAEWDRANMFAGYSLFLFSPRFTRDHPERVQEWIDRAAGTPVRPEDQAIALSRIAMIENHDCLADLPRIDRPTLVLCAEHNHCTPLPLSEEIAAAIPNAALVVIRDAGELVELEKPQEFAAVVRDFARRNG